MLFTFKTEKCQKGTLSDEKRMKRSQKLIHKLLGGEEGSPKYSSPPYHVSLRASLKIPPMMMLLMSKTWNSPHYSVCFSPDILKKKVSFLVHRKYEHVCNCARVEMEHLQNILFGEADQLFSYGARLLFSPSSSHLSRKGKLALDQESLSDSEDVALIRKSEKKSLSVGEICSDWKNLQLGRAQFHTTLRKQEGGWKYTQAT